MRAWDILKSREYQPRRKLMRAWQLSKPRAVEERPLAKVDLPMPEIGERDLLIRVRVCGVCHTDLHIVEGDIALPTQPIVPGHQIVGTVERAGAGVSRFGAGDRVGVPWLNWADGDCFYCRKGLENLCDKARFTGYHVNGGYAEYQVTEEGFAYKIPDVFSDEQAAPLLCAGVVGYRALRLAGAEEVERLGMYGFGASAHIALQIARFRGAKVYVFTRGREHRELAKELGAEWTGGAEDDPGAEMDASIIFAPAGGLVPPALRRLRKGGTLVLAGIHMSPIPELDYALIWGERSIKSVANATRRDAEEMLQLAAQIPARTEVEVFPMDEANEVLLKLKRSQIRGAAVLAAGAE
jgi:alcohol dehydrogenase, propanol-preferring